MSNRVPRWYTRYVICENAPAAVRAGQSRQRVETFKNLVNQSTTIDARRPARQFVVEHPGDPGKVLLIIRVGILVTETDAVEWSLDDWLQLLVRIDDRIAAGYDNDARAHGHASETMWAAEMAELASMATERCAQLQAELESRNRRTTLRH